MDGTGKCYWLDCALLNAFFPPSSFFLLRPEFGLAVLHVLSICISLPIYLFIYYWHQNHGKLLAVT